ncbi:MAG TPA: DUF1648 domain-containing protein [Pseudobacteroides sp.]|uniref:DUF1648 domain-containing protein n=1 Tax=Pseudobacteroides sp. TaxID=1968840 RepID=UPI002F9423D2
MNKNDRPSIKIQFSLLEKVLEGISIFCIGAIIVVLFINWMSLPDRIPIHFGISGSPDSWGDKIKLIYIPIVMIFIYVMLTLVARFPHTFNYLVEITQDNAKFQYQNARKMILWLKAEIIIVFGYIEWITILVAHNRKPGMDVWFLPVFLILLFGTVIYHFLKMIRNR